MLTFRSKAESTFTTAVFNNGKKLEKFKNQSECNTRGESVLKWCSKQHQLNEQISTNIKKEQNER